MVVHLLAADEFKLEIPCENAAGNRNTGSEIVYTLTMDRTTQISIDIRICKSREQYNEC
jgi:hypothetical protein